MPVFMAPQLEELAGAIFRAAGAPEDIAAHVARSLVTCNLVGHDSHGVIRVPNYIDVVNRGGIVPAARPAVGKETPTTAVVDGNWAFGQITAAYAAKVAIEKARAANVAAVGMIRCNHIGRLGEYIESCTREGMVAFLMGTHDGRTAGSAVAPYGGAARIFSTNPLAFGVPAAEGEPVLADMATSVVAEGKLRVARAKKQPIEPGAILDKEGNPSTNPEDYYAGGMLLPFGGHKGYALAVIADLLGRYLPGGEALTGPWVSFSNLLVVIDVGAFRPKEEFRSAVEGRLRQIKAVKPAPGFEEVLLPGEPERRTLARRSVEGIPLPEDTWQQICDTARKLQVPLPE